MRGTHISAVPRRKESDFMFSQRVLIFKRRGLSSAAPLTGRLIASDAADGPFGAGPGALESITPTRTAGCHAGRFCILCLAAHRGRY